MKNKEISLIVAMDENGLIGNDDKIPWDVPEDLALFKEITTNNIVIMGRRTFDSIGKPLPNRLNIVITKNKTHQYNDENVIFFDCPDKALKFAKNFNDKKIFIIGGRSIYCYFLNLVNDLHISYIKGTFKGNIFFPSINLSEYSVINTVIFDKFKYIHYRKNSCN